jgi:NADH:ubiquinone oxidoreductase subunit F (NADH-binding)
MVVDTRAMVIRGAESISVELGDGRGAGTFRLRLLGHNRVPLELEVPCGMTLGELAQREGVEGWGEVSAINAGGVRLRSGNVLRPQDSPVIITGRLSGAVA